MLCAISLGPDDVPWGRVAIALAYLLCAWACVLAYKTEKHGPDRPLRQTVPALWRVLRKHWPHPPKPARRAAVWLALTLGALLAALASAVDLHERVAEVGRLIAQGDGWYAGRTALQTGAVLGVAAVAGVVLWVMRRLLSEQAGQFRLVVIGVVVLLAFWGIRAVSLHDVDTVMRFSVLGVRVQWLIELTGIGLLVLAAAGRIRERLRDRG